MGRGRRRSWRKKVLVRRESRFRSNRTRNRRNQNNRKNRTEMRNNLPMTIKVMDVLINRQVSMNLQFFSLNHNVLTILNLY